MSIFFNFDDDPVCNWCGESVLWCTCGTGPVIPSEPFDGRIVVNPKTFKDHFWVRKEIDGKLIGKYVDGRNDGMECEWVGEYLVLQNVTNGLNERDS